MQVGDIMYVGSMGPKFNHCGYPVLVVSINDKGDSCYGLINGEVRWYSIRGLRKEKNDGNQIKRRNQPSTNRN